MSTNDKTTTGHSVDSNTLLAELHQLASEWRRKARLLDEMAIKAKGGSEKEKRCMTKAGMFRGCALDLKRALKANVSGEPRRL